MHIDQANAAAIRDLWSQVEPKLAGAANMEQAAQPLCEAVYSKFKDSALLTRIFITVPLGALPAGNAEFVRKLAGSAKLAEQLDPATRVLSLVGSYGDEKNWQDRRQSNGHVGIPLISSQFVSGIPMISRLLKELGVPMAWLDSKDTEIVKKTLGETAGLFHVDHAGEAVDTEGRKIIAAQDFVAKHGVESVFGVGGAYFGGAIVVLVVFCRVSVNRKAAGLFLPLVSLFKSKTTSLAEPTRIFAA